MFGFFVKAFVLISGIFTTLALAVVVAFETFDMFPGTETDGLFGIATYPADSGYILVVSMAVAIVIAIAGFYATTVAFESVESD